MTLSVKRMVATIYTGDPINTRSSSKVQTNSRSEPDGASRENSMSGAENGRRCRFSAVAIWPER